MGNTQSDGRKERRLQRIKFVISDEQNSNKVGQRTAVRKIWAMWMKKYEMIMTNKNPDCLNKRQSF